MVSPLPEIVTLVEAFRHLRVSDDAEDTMDISLKLDQATAIVLDYLDRESVTWTAEMVGWTSTTAPQSVRAAVLAQLGELYRFRGDEEMAMPKEPGRLSTVVERALYRYRDPALS